MSARWTSRAAALMAVAFLTASTGLAQPMTAPASQPSQAEATTQPAEKPAVATTQPAETPTAAPTTQPALAAAAPATQPAVALQARPPEPSPANIRFQFKGESYADLVKFIANVAGKPVLGDPNAVQGQLTYFDAAPYTFDEALGIVNLVLRNAGFNLIDAGRYMELVRIDQMAQNTNLPLLIQGLDEEPRRADEEIVTTILPLQYLDGEQAVQIVARMVHRFGTLSRLESGKGIIITDTVNNIRRIQRLLRSMDQGTLATEQLKYYRLKNASAGEVSQLIERLFGQSQRPRRYAYSRERGRYEPAPAEPSDIVTVTADARSNTVVVIASPDRHAMIEEMISRLDVEETTGAGAIRIFELKSAKAGELVKTLSAAVPSTTITVRDQRGQPISRQIPSARIVADEATNRVVVSAEPDVMKQIEVMITELDGAAVEAAGLRIFPLKVANAPNLVNVITNTFALRDPRGRPVTTFAVTAEPRTNSLVVRAPAAEMEAIAKLIEEFDQQTDTEREFHVVRLAAGDARELARSLMSLLSQQRDPRRPSAGEETIRVEADPGTNSLMISAAPGEWLQIKSVLDQLTKEAPAAVASTRIFKLEHAKAPEVAAALQRVFDARRTSPRRGQPQPIPVVIAYDARTNSIIASAGGDELAEIAELLKPIDVPPALAAQVQVRSYTLTNASAAELARSLGRLFAAQRSRQQGPSEEIQPRFEAEPTANQLVVAATAEQFEVIEELIQQMQKAAQKSETVVKLFPLTHAKADQLAGALTGVVQAELEAAQRRSGSPNRRGEFQVSVDPRTNSLLVTAPTETMVLIEQLLPKLDAAETKVQLTKVLELQNADPAELAEAINAALAGQPAAQPSRRGGGQVPLTGLAGRKVVVVPEQSARAVLLTGVSEDVEFAEKLIQQIDARPSSEKATVQTFRLKHAQAEELARVLAETVGRMRPGRGGVPTSISADKNANAIIVSAAGDVIERVQELLSQLDVEGATEGAITVEIVRLVNAKAEPMAAALNAAQGTSPRRRGPRGPEEEEVVRVTADAASNSLLLTGRPAQIEETKKLIVQLDQAAAELTSETRVFPLAQAKAADLVTVLERILLEPGAGRGRTQAAGEARIAAHEKANAVVVAGPPETIALAAQIIKQFDGEIRPETVIQIVPLTRAEANSLAQAVNEILAEQATRDPRRPAAAGDNAVVVPEPNSNSLLVRGSRAQVQQAVELIRKLDEGGEGFATQVRVFPLNNADALQAAKTLELLFRQIIQQQQRQGGKNAPPPPTFSIAADERTNSLIVSTSASNFAILESLLAKMDQEASAALRDVQYIPLLHASADDLVSKVEAMFADRKLADRPVIEADALSNGLTIVAKDADYRAIETVVAKWDEAAEANYIETRVLPLTNQVRAQDMAEAIKRLYEQISGQSVQLTDKLPPRTAQEASSDLFILPAAQEPPPAAPARGAPAGAAPEAKGPTTQPAKAAAPTTQPTTAPAPKPAAPILVAVDPKSNSLIVSAPRTEMEAIQSLIWDITSSALAADAELRVFKVKIADPNSIARTLNTLFNPRPVAAPARQPQQRGQRGEQAAQPPQPAKPTILVAADARTRSVIVRAKPVDLTLIEELIKQLDEAPVVVSDVRIFPLKNTDATEVAQNLRELFQIASVPGAGGPRGREARGPQAAQPPAQQAAQQAAQQITELRGADGEGIDLTASMTISANRMTNSVIVAAPPEVMGLIANLVEQLDQEPAAGGSAVRMFPVEHAEVNEVADAVSRIFGSRRAPGGARGGQAGQTAGAVVTANEAARMVIVMARVDELPLIEQVIKQLDQAGAADSTTVKVYPLQHGDARSVAEALSRTLSPSAAPAGGGRRGQAVPAAGASLRISPEPTANAIVARASEEDHQRLAALIKELDTPPAQQATFATIALKRADARDVANALNQMLRSWARNRNQPSPSVGYDAKSNTLMISGQQEDMALIEAMVAKLEAGAQEKVQVQLIALKNARAFDVAQQLGSFYGPRAQSADPTDRLVTLVPDDRTNSVLISARAEQFDEIAKLIVRLDVADATGEGRTIVLPLTYAQADAAARAITQAFTPQRGQRVSPADLVVAAAEPGTNALIVSASEANLQKIQTLVKELDVETSGGRTVEFMILANAKAADLAKTLALVVSRQGRQRTTEEPPTVSAHVDSNALVIAGKKADIAPLMAMAKQLDQAAQGQATDVYILPLKKADAVEMADMVSRLFRDAAQAARQAGKAVEPVAVSADARANALILVASADQRAVVEKLVNQIDEMSSPRANLRLIQLKDAKPDDVLKAIQQLYGSGANGRVTRPTPARPGGTAGRTTGPEAAVVAGPRGLLVSASEEEWAAIQELVKQMEEAAAKEKQQVLLFPLANASNTSVAAALTAMYRAAAAGRPEDAVTVTALPGTSAVVVTASKEKMEEVGQLIKQLDQVEVAGKSEYRVFSLARAKAAKILPVLNQLLQPMRQMRPTQPISVTADPTTNTIVVATQAPVMDEIARIIQTLDNVQVFEAAEVMVIRLKNADATSLAAALTDILTPGTSAIQTPEAKALQEQIRLLRTVKGKEGLPPLDLSKPIKITADPLRRGEPGSNALIISSTADNLQALAEIVTLLDTIPLAKGLKLQIINLKNADAITVTTLLREIFAAGWQATGRPGSPTADRALQPEGLVGEALTGGLNITADARTNTLVLAGAEETVALALLIVKDLDGQPTSAFTEVKLFKLEHANAADLANLLRAIFAEQPAQVPGVEGAKAYVSRLRIQREKDKPVEAQIARTHPTVAVQAETKANILIVAARSDLIGIIEEMVKSMDIPGAGSMNVVRIYPLDNADATRMAQVITGLYTGPNANLIRPEDRPTITVDVRTNSLVVSASDKTFLMIDALLKKLDAKLPIDLRDIRLMVLENADATALAPTLQQMMDARVQRQVSLGVKDAEALRMIIVPDARSNSLIVGGSKEGFQVVADLAKLLDSAAPALSGQIQLMPLTNANSGTLSATLNNLFTQRYQAVTAPEVRRQRPVIVPDLRTNSLMVAANQDDSKVIASLVGKLDAAPVSPAVELVVLPLKFNDAGSVGPIIERIFADRLRSMTPPTQTPAPQDQVSVAADALSNALVVSASKENLALIRELLTKVDVEPPTETGVVRLYQIQYADVSRVEAMLQALLSQGLYKPGLVGAANNAIAQAREKVSISSDLRTNVLIVSASKENFAVLDEIIKKIDVKEGWGLTGNIQVYILKHADAARLGPVLQDMFDRKRAAEAATGSPPRSLPVVVIPDPRTNSLLVAGSKEAFDDMSALVGKLDVAELVQTYDFRVFYLKQASAATLQPVLQQLFAQRRPGGAAAPTPVTVIADAKLNALIVGAAKDDLALAEGLVARLDTTPPEAGQVIRAFPVTKADAAQLAQTLQQLFQAQRPGQPLGIAISVDERSNTLLVSAAPADMDSLADLVAKLDTAPVTDVTEIRIFTLRHADAAELATILTDALTNRPKALTSESPNRVTLLRFITNSPEGKELMESALKRGVMITAVPRTNSLLVQAPVETMPLLNKLITALDQTSPRAAEIRVFPLVNADATQLARVLGELFRLQAAGTQRQAATYTMGPSGGQATSQPAAAVVGSAEQEALTITVDPRTNSLLVGGTREYVELVATVIRELDASPAEDRQSIVYRLRNRQAADIQQALSQFLDQERQRLAATLGTDAMGAAKELLAREISIVAEPTSNTLLISGSPRFFRTIWEMVRELDQPPPQVMIQVLLAEVQLDDKTELGVEWSLIGHPDERTIGARTSFGIDTTGFNFSVSSGDFHLLLRALQSQGRVEVLSTPRIVAVDNLPAQINIGQEVPYVTSSRETEAGSVFNTIANRPVGTILALTPRINPDGFVTLHVRPEISSLSESTVDISEGLKAPIFNTRFAETDVTVQDGHTIVIGGLITKKKENREDKVPLLGDIPLLGWLFKSTRVVTERTELLVILTPRILRTAVDADVISNKMVRDLGLSQGLHTESSIGELLNPLRGVTPQEVKRLENGGLSARPASQPGMIVLPRKDRPGQQPPPEGSEQRK